MKKITNLLIVASLALAGAVMAQEPTPEDANAPTKKEAPGKKPRAEKPVAPPQAPNADAPKAPKPEAPQAPKVDAPKGPKADVPHAPKVEAPKGPKADAPAVKEPAANEAPPPPKVDKKAPPTQKPPAPAAPDTSRNDKKAPAPKTDAAPSTAPATTTTTAAPMTAPITTPAAPMSTTTPVTAATAAPMTAATTTPAATAAATAAPVTAAQTNPTSSVNPAAVKAPDPQKVQQIKQQHMSFHAQARPSIVAAVTFSPNYRIENSDRWQGPQYEVYRSYRPERHDQGYYRSKYQRVELIAGGYYYFHNNYWYPAWGYSPREEYYAYDAPIYVGKHAEPPDKVIADVQAVLQEMGYYNGEVDGLLGPLTRQALIGYQSEHGMMATAVIDQPTLDALGMG